MSNTLSHCIQNSVREKWVKVIIKSRIGRLSREVVIVITRNPSHFRVSIESMGIIFDAKCVKLYNIYEIINKICGKIDIENIDIIVTDEL